MCFCAYMMLVVCTLLFIVGFVYMLGTESLVCPGPRLQLVDRWSDPVRVECLKTILVNIIMLFCYLIISIIIYYMVVCYSVIIVCSSVQLIIWIQVIR